MSGADTVYPTPSAHPMAGRWMPDLQLPDLSPRGGRVAKLMRAGRPVFLELAGRADLAAAVAPWSDRVDVVSSGTAEPPADAILIRPDGYVAWAGSDERELVHALETWFGAAQRLSAAGTRGERSPS
jgi:hypothetical protein